MGTAVREFPADVVVRPAGSDRQTARDSAAAVDWVLCVDWPERDHYKERLFKETIVESLKEIREQNPVGRILIIADNYSSHHVKFTTTGRRTRHRVRLYSTVSPTLNAIEPL